MRLGPAIRAASFVDLSSCLPPARERRERRYWSDSSSRMSATFTSTGCRAAILRITSPQPLRWPAANPLQERDVEEAAMPGQPVRTRARFPNVPGNSPSRIASCPRRHRNRRSASVERSNVFAGPTLRQKLASRNRKPFPSCAETVEDSTSLWKPEEICAKTSATKMYTLILQ
jgi:hypothetical protein